MKRLRFGFVLVSLSVAWAALAGLSPGPTVVTPVFTTSAPGVADIDRDGLSDFVLSSTYLRNEGGGVFVERDLGLIGMAGLNGGDAVIGLLDVNGDGRTDLLTNDRPASPPGMDKGARTYRLYIAGEQLPYRDPITLGKGLRPYIVDANGDGKDDLVLATSIHKNKYESPDQWQVLISRGNGTFETRQTFRIEGHPQGVEGRRLYARDINHDGLPDLVVRTAEAIEVLRGIGNGDFAPADVRYIPNRYFGGWAMELADVDGDSHVDIILTGWRMVRVFFGDGTGRFPRYSAAAIPQLREVPNLRPGNNPDTLVIGQFVRRGRTEIAVDTPEGDVVVLAYEHGKLREVSRTQTEYTRIDLALGDFREAGKPELYVNGHFTPEGLKPPPPRLFQIDALAAAADATPIFTGRSRAVRGTASTTLNLEVQVIGTCAPAATTWSLQREGVFGLDPRSDQLVQTMTDDGAIVFRLTVPWSWTPVTGRLEPKGSRRYEGKGFAETTCGAAMLDFVAIER